MYSLPVKEVNEEDVALVACATRFKLLVTMFTANMSRMLRLARVCQLSTNPSALRINAALNVCDLMSRRSLTSAAVRRSFLKHKHKVITKTFA